MNIDIMRGAIAEMFKTNGLFAVAMGWHKNKVSAMLNGRYVPDVDEAAMMAHVLRLNEEKFCQIFLH
jgi:hypothetical protein